MAYMLVAGIYLVAPRYRRLALGGALSYGSLVGLARIVSGAHFASDVLWSGSLMCFTVATLHAVLPATSSPDSATGVCARCEQSIQWGDTQDKRAGKACDGV